MLSRTYTICVMISFFIVGCISSTDEPPVEWVKSSGLFYNNLRKAEISAMEQSFIDAGLIEISTLDSTIIVDLRYGTTNNFLGIDMYDGFNKCYLQKPVAEMLVNAQQALKRKNPDLTLVVWDAARPQYVQQMMWDSIVPPKGVNKSYFVSNPKRGSIHNFGCAVDVTIADNEGNLLDMGTDFDYFGREAWPIEEKNMLKAGKLNKDQINNRKLLREVMYEAGFWNIQKEWWHFNAMRRNVAREKFEIIK